MRNCKAFNLTPKFASMLVSGVYEHALIWEREHGLGVGLPLLVILDEVVLIPTQLKYSQRSYNHELFIYCTP